MFLIPYCLFILVRGSEYNYTFKNILITQNETIPLNLPSLVIPFDNLDNVKQLPIMEQQMTLYSEYKKFPLIDFGFTPFVFQNNSTDELKICLLGEHVLRCSYFFKNLIYDGQLIIEVRKTDSIPIQQLCQNIHQLTETEYVIQCAIDSKTYLFQILNQTGQVFDTIQLQIRESCKGVSKIVKQQLFFYESMCTDPTFLLINVDIATLKFQDTQTIIINKEMFDEDPKKLIDANFCGKNILILNFEYHLIEYNIITQGITIKRSSETIIHGIYKECSHFLTLLFQGKSSQYFDFALDIEFEQVQQIAIVNDNLILLSNNTITIYNNQYLNQTLPGQYNNFRELANLPFILVQSIEGDIIFYQIHQYQNSLTYSNTKYLAIYEKEGLSLSSYPKVILTAQLYDLNHPKIILQQNQSYHNIFFSTSFIRIQFRTIVKGLPITIGTFDDKNHIVSSIVQTQNSSCSFQNLSNFEILEFLYLEGNHEGLIYVDSLNRINIYDCFSEKIIVLQNITSKIYNIFTHTLASKFLISTREYIYSVIIDQDFQIQLNIILETKGQNYKIRQSENDILILLQNCSIIYMNYDFLPIVIFDYYLNQNCISSLEFSKQNLFINNSNILYTNQGNNYLFTFENIISASLNGKSLLVFQLINGKIIMNLYFFGKTLFFLFEIPTYHYNISQPLKYVVLSKTYISIAAYDNNAKKVLLVYDLTKEASDCLIQVIPTDNYIFGITTYMRIVGLWFVYENHILLSKIYSSDIYFDLDFKSDKMTSQFLIELSLISKIKCEPQIFKLYINYSNNNNILRYKQQATNKSIYFDTSSYAIQNLSNIFGSIYSIQSLSENQIQAPIQVLSYNLKCSYFQYSFCFINQTIYYQSFQNQKIIYQSNDIQRIYYIEKLSENQYSIFYLNELDQLFVLNFIDSIGIQSINKINQFQLAQQKILQINGDIILFQKLEKQYISFYQREASKFLVMINNRFYQHIGTIQLEENIYFLVQLDQNGSILLSKQAFIKQNLQVKQILFFRFKLQEPLKLINPTILNYNLNEDFLQIEIIASQNQNNFWYIYQINLNITTQEVLDQYISNYIRLENYDVATLLMYNKDFLILKAGMRGNIIDTLLLYDISNRYQNEIIDYIYQRLTNITAVQIYNQSHYVTIIEKDEYQYIELVKFDKYRFICNQQCTNNSYEILLFNNVSNLSVSLHNKQIQKTERDEKIIYNILIGNFLLITGICFFKQSQRTTLKLQSVPN